MVVVFPAPLGPRKPNVSPLLTSKSIPRTASSSPYFLVKPETVLPAPAVAVAPEVSFAKVRAYRGHAVRLPLPLLVPGRICGCLARPIGHLKWASGNPSRGA